MAGLGQLLKAFATLVPLWVWVPLAVVGAVVLVPAWLESIRHRQVRGLVRRSIRADPEERLRLEKDAVALCAERIERWSTLAHSADHYGQPRLRDRALSKLKDLGAHDIVRRWQDKDKRPTPRIRDPIEALVRIEGLYASGLTDAADEALAAARRTFPDDPDLLRLQREHPPTAGGGAPSR